MSEIPQAARVDLLEPVRLLHEHLTAPLCEAAFEEVRGFERRRVWTLERLAKFWVAVVLRSPPSLTHALEEATAGRGGYPGVESSPQAFFARSTDLSGKFFARVFEAFGASVAAAEPPRFCSELAPLFARFAGHVFVLDGSTLDPVARRLKLLWDDKRLPMPGSVEALYDLGRGTVASLRYDPTPQGVEQLAARDVLPHAGPGTLVVADRLYGLPWFFAFLSQKDVFGLARRHGRAKFTVERSLSSREVDGGVVEDQLGTLGTGRRVPGQAVRCITLKRPGEPAIALLTNVLDPATLTAEEALDLYRRRWRVERLFYDLKEVLNLHCFYAANTNAIAMQIYAAAIVHVALRTAQGRVAAQARRPPEALSTAKLFPKVAAASICLVQSELTFLAICRANPGITLRKPDWYDMAFAYADLEDVLVEPRKPGGNKTGLRAPRRARRPLPPPPERPKEPRPRRPRES